MPLYAFFLSSLDAADYNPSIPRSSYYTKDYRQTAALIRARQPYLVKNIFTGLGIASFAIGVCKSFCRLDQARDCKDAVLIKGAHRCFHHLSSSAR